MPALVPEDFYRAIKAIEEQPPYPVPYYIVPRWLYKKMQEEQAAQAPVE